MTGLIAIPARPTQPIRHEEVYNALDAMEKPPGTKQRVYLGLAHENHTKAVRDMLTEGFDWIFFVDDDELLPPDALMRLLRRNLDIVSVNFLSKENPWTPYMFQRIAGLLVPMPLPHNRGLCSVDACGLGGVLVRRHVLAQMTPPWFGVTSTLRTDDLFFCHAARSAGFEIVVDLDICASHIIKGCVRPYWDESRSQWVTMIDIKAGGSYAMPPAEPTPEYQEWLDRQHGRSLKGRN